MHAEVETAALALPAAELVIQWGDHRVYKVAGKLFAIQSAPGTPWAISLKVTPESFTLLTEAGLARQAPYLARGGWVQIDAGHGMPVAEVTARLEASYRLVRAGLPRKVDAALG
jgi:predicted DNA-binding protein (MmcQ/YjbR family)